ncbi:MAG: c-type cytochrome [Planctomycetaceae bacterium]
MPRIVFVSLLATFVALLTTGVRAELGATPVESIRTLPGFQAELLYSVPREEQGSWVSLTVDDKGRLITCDQYGKLYRVTPQPVGVDLAKNPAGPTIEPIDLEIGMAQGLLYAFDSLYISVNANQTKNSGKPPVPSGLYRAQDTNGDDKYDTLTQLREFDGHTEHGPHGVVLSPDGKSIYVCAGNHVQPPDQETSRVPQVWDEDFLLSRMWDARGHARGRLAPGGWIARTDPEGKSFELVAIGFRNEYDIAFNTAGELFTYDADMEWDIGTPWYRPTRVNHVVSGVDFGWRSGTGKWPEYYPDSFGSVVDIGPGSPTGITFGTGAKFPAKYQQGPCSSPTGAMAPSMLFTCGRTERPTPARPRSSSPLQPLPVTDMVVHPDGSLYLTIGGRETQSGLYRVTYTGEEATAPVESKADAGQPLRELRRQLEALHVAGVDDDLDFIWQHLSHADRTIRSAARIALEHQPVVKWRARAIEEQNPLASMQAVIALARHGSAAQQSGTVESLARIDWKPLSTEQRLDLLRAWSLTFSRLGHPSSADRTRALVALDGHFPASDRRINREIAAVLVYLEAPHIAERVVEQLVAARTQEDQIQFALILKDLTETWTPAAHEAYFSWFHEAASGRGGMSYGGFLSNIRDEAIARLDEVDRKLLEPILSAKVEPVDPIAELSSRPIVKDYSVAELLPVIDAKLQGRNFEQGRELFAQAACFKCHRVQGEGGSVGPDLTGVGSRFNHQNLLESMIEPSKVISDQYEMTQFVLDDGRTITGRVINLNGKNLQVMTNMFDPSALEAVNRDQIELVQPARVSMMPEDLLDRFSEEEILDLIAYLKSGGDPDHEAFK